MEKEAEGELKEKIRALRKEVDRREGISRKKWIGTALLGIVGLATVYTAYNEFVFRPEQARKPYREAGLSQEQAEEFIKNYPQQNGNSVEDSFHAA
ncbi:MAG: hypothetical protein QXF82_06630 [Nitrososphaeria archaeon]